jgi:hypothetical protein
LKSSIFVNTNQKENTMKHLFKALAEFQQEVPVIFKATTAGTGNFAYQYADLPAIFNVINPLLAKHGLGFTQLTNHKEGIDYLTTVVFHVESGETLETSLRLLPEVELKNQNIFQSYGSQLTYFRRYGISQILGLVTDKDTDAHGEVNKKKPALAQERFENGLNQVENGEMSAEKFKKALTAFQLTEAQTKTLELI